MNKRSENLEKAKEQRGLFGIARAWGAGSIRINEIARGVSANLENQICKNEKPCASQFRRFFQILLASVAFVLSAQALDIQLTYHSSIPADKLEDVTAAMDRAAEIWEDLLTDDVTVTIEVKWTPGFANPSEGARATVYYVPFPYTKVRDALIERIDSAEDQSAVATLPGQALPLMINLTANNPHGAGSTTPYVDDDGDKNNTTMRVSLANAKVLGLLPADFVYDDGKITISGMPSWDFDPSDGIVPGQADCVAICLHEIGHVLGMNSLIDGRHAASPGKSDDQYPYMTPLDLFRYSRDSTGHKVPDWSSDSRVKYFSIDGGVNPIADFSTGILGDGSDPSHWSRDGELDGIFEPSVYPLQQVERPDLTALDVIGWTVRPLEQILEITSARMTDKGLRLEWSPVEGYTGYKVMMAEGITSEFVELSSGDKGANFFQSDQKEGINFFYVEAYK